MAVRPGGAGTPPARRPRRRLPPIRRPHAPRQRPPLRAVVEHRLTLPDHDELRAHAAAAIAKHSRRGWRIDKANRSDQVDAVVALAMALDAKERAPEPVRLLGFI